MLVLIATPIGNLEDLSSRAIKTLASCHLLLCEDTRYTGRLLDRLSIQVPFLRSIHKFNETRQIERVIHFLREGKQVGLVSDAGTPGISDPGGRLVARCHEEGLSVTIVPGPSAFVSAYALSGAMADRVQFLGFLPKSHASREKILREMMQYPGATVIYESPHRLGDTLSAAATLAPQWKVTLVRELTKKFEQVRSDDVSVLKDAISSGVKGECTLVFHPIEEKIEEVDLVSEVFCFREMYESSLKGAVAFVAEKRKRSRRWLYQQCVARQEKVGS